MSVVVKQSSHRAAVAARAMVALGTGLGLLLTLAAGSGGAGAAGSGVPYSDPSSDGAVGLCNTQGQQITSGSATTAPFTWRAVSTAAATGAYAGSTRTAILYAYQPIKGLAPDDWSGAQLTSSSRYTNPANPMAAATDGDNSLATFMRDFAPQWDGYLQLRIYLGAANEQPYEVHYPTLDIVVTGSTWHAVDSVPVNCNSGTAESIESILLPASDLRQPSSSGAATASGAAGSTSGGAPAAASGSSGAGSGTRAPGHSSPAPPPRALAASAPASGAPGASPAWLYVALGALVVALGVIFGVFLPRRRQRRRRGGRAGEAIPESVVNSAIASDSEPEPRSLAVTSTKGISS